ncbi:MAG: protein-glutamate O-methyltransferase CheR [Syntrophomonadaceae bacterium]|nr:protein-glutamate O-methyltransferase CheR [Syntrophomonadaceae bacterium]
MEALSDAQYHRYSQFIHKNVGINLGETRKEILEVKLRKLMARAGIKSYENYFDTLINSKNDQAILKEFINEITVNKTQFFRENTHFNFIEGNPRLIMERNPRISQNQEIRAWCAGCSTGEEAYTLAMVLQENFPLQDIKILATDINTEVLQKAVKGKYSDSIKEDITWNYLSKYFKQTDSGLYVCNSIKRKVVFRQFNLIHEFPFKKGFDMIFCRNVMIYFDTPVQKKLLHKFYNVLVAGGLLFIGHAEGLANMGLDYTYILPAVYMK